MSQTLHWKKRRKPFFAHLKCKYHKFKNSSCVGFCPTYSHCWPCLVFAHSNPFCLHVDLLHNVVSTWNSNRCSRIPILLFSTATWSKLLSIRPNSSYRVVLFFFFFWVYITSYSNHSNCIKIRLSMEDQVISCLKQTGMWQIPAFWASHTLCLIVCV